MKKLFQSVLVTVLAICSFATLAQTYPITNPTYIPTAVLAPQTFTTTGDYVYAVSGISTVTVRVSGTCTSLVSAPQGTNDGTNWTTIQAIPVAGGANVTSITGTGFWRVNTSGFTKTRLHITVLAASCTVAMSGSNSAGALYLQNPNTTVNPTAITDQTGANYLAVDSSGIGSIKLTNGTQSMPTMDAVARKGFMAITDGTSTAGVTAASTAAVAATPAIVVAQSPNGADPCANPNVAKSSVALNIASAISTKVVALTSSQIIYVCGYSGTVTGTSPTVQFTYGTNVAAECDTGATILTGAMEPVDGSFIAAFTPATMFKTAASKDLCVVTTGTTPHFKGVLTYVKQ